MCQLTEKVIFSGRAIKFQLRCIAAAYRYGKNDSWLIICQLEDWEKTREAEGEKFP
jgi:hypothetical protein